MRGGEDGSRILVTSAGEKLTFLQIVSNLAGYVIQIRLVLSR